MDISNSINLINNKSLRTFRYNVTEEEVKVLENAVTIRNNIANKAGFDNYYEYCLSINKDLYSSSDVENLISDVKEFIVPLSLRLEKLLLDKYDFTLDFQNGDVYFNTEELMENVCAVYKDSCPELSQLINYIEEKKLMSIPLYGLTPTINLRITEGSDNIISIADFQTFHHTIGPSNFMYSLGVLNDLYRNKNNDKSYTNNYGLLYTRKSLRYITFEQYDKLYGQQAEYSMLIDICTELRGVLKTAALCEIAKEIYSTDNPTLDYMNKITKQKFQEYGPIQNHFEFYAKYKNWSDTISVLYQSSISDIASPCLYRLSSLELMRKYYNNTKSAYDTYIKLVDMRDISNVTEPMHKLNLSSPFDDDFIDTLSKFLLKTYNNI